GAGLFVRTLRNLKQLDAGFNQEGALTLQIHPLATVYQGPRLMGLYKEILRRVETMPGVRSASLSTLSPPGGNDRVVMIDIPGFTPNAVRDITITMNQISPEYFSTMGIGLAQGRPFTERDNEAAPKVALLNETAARFYFGNQNPLGSKISFVG